MPEPFDKSLLICKINLYTCNITSRVTFNHITEEREINIYEEYDSDTGIHFFHTEVWEEPPNVHSVFSVYDIHNCRVPEKKIWIDFSKTEDIFVSKNKMNTFGVYVRFVEYLCQVTGVRGTQILKTVWRRATIHPDVGHVLFALVSDLRCSEDENLKHKGIHCACQEYTRGERCEKIYCDVQCDPKYGVCVKNNACKCLVNTKTGPFCNQTICPKNEICQNGGKCRVIYNRHLCVCDRHKYTGQMCEKSCDPPCVHGICVVSKDTKIFCSCDEGYIGNDCSQLSLNINNVKIPRYQVNSLESMSQKLDPAIEIYKPAPVHSGTNFTSIAIATLFTCDRLTLRIGTRREQLWVVQDSLAKNSPQLLCPHEPQ
ncbi:hypothetical protein RF11_13729 [Thelohanellus kitauei]|uniref:EGF-like domain-containing protein n=1 Tax=Thelohanellus kitauei TaxID=669202 RepID=A0A0C2MQK5_THEKT|nr:hypothetical protein RF11_13729 [Thelohanellus kitauei]